MSDGTTGRLRVTIELPQESSASSLSALYPGIAAAGARIVDLTVADQLQTSKPSAAEPCPVEVEEYSLNDTYPVMHSVAFKKYVVDEHGLSPSWSTRLWNSMSDAVQPEGQHRHDPYEWIAMGDIRRRIRQMEAGGGRFWGIHKESWNILATLNNDFEEDPDKRILLWVDDLHPYLRHDPSSQALSRQAAISGLAHLYQEMRQQD